MKRRRLAKTSALSGRFLAKLVRLMEDIQQIRCVTFARE